MRLNAKLIAYNAPTTNTDASQKFYSALLGGDFARSFTEATRSHHTPLTEDGLWLWITTRNNPQEGGTAVFAVDDLDAALAALKAAGGTVVAGPFNLPISPKLQQTYNTTVKQSASGNLGKFSLVHDPDNNYMWVGQLEPHAHEFFGYGSFDRGLSQAKVDAHNATRNAGSILK